MGLQSLLPPARTSARPVAEPQTDRKENEMSKRFWSPGYLFLMMGAMMISASSIEAAQTPGPGGTYNCWDRCRHGVSCATRCYEDEVWTSCGEYHYSCGGDSGGGQVGQGCGDGMCGYDAYLGYENYTSCPTDCGGTCVPSGGWDDTLQEADCCSGQAVPGSTVCFGSPWENCFHVCQ